MRLGGAKKRDRVLVVRDVSLKMQRSRALGADSLDRTIRIHDVNTLDNIKLPLRYPCWNGLCFCIVILGFFYTTFRVVKLKIVDNCHTMVNFGKKCDGIRDGYSLDVPSNSSVFLEIWDQTQTLGKIEIVLAVWQALKHHKIQEKDVLLHSNDQLRLGKYQLSVLFHYEAHLRYEDVLLQVNIKLGQWEDTNIIITEMYTFK